MLKWLASHPLLSLVGGFPLPRWSAPSSIPALRLLLRGSGPWHAVATIPLPMDAAPGTIVLAVASVPVGPARAPCYMRSGTAASTLRPASFGPFKSSAAAACILPLCLTPSSLTWFSVRVVSCTLPGFLLPAFALWPPLLRRTAPHVLLVLPACGMLAPRADALAAPAHRAV